MRLCGSFTPFADNRTTNGEKSLVAPKKRKEQANVSYVHQNNVEKVYVLHSSRQGEQVGNVEGQGVDLRKRVIGRSHIERQSRIGVYARADRNGIAVDFEVDDKILYESACNGGNDNDGAVVDKRNNAVLDGELIVPQSRGQNAQAEENAVSEAEVQNGEAAKNAVVAHFVLAEVDEDRQRAHCVDKERNSVKRALFEYNGRARRVHAYIAYEERQCGEHGAVHVIAVAQKNAVLAVVLDKQGEGERA